MRPRGPAVLVLVLASSLACGGVVACGAFGAEDATSPTPGTEAGAPDGAGVMPESGGPPDGGVPPDSGPPSCAGGVRFSGLTDTLPSAFTTVGKNILSGGKLVSTATWSAGAGAQSYVEAMLVMNPVSVSASYKMKMSGADQYAEIGCHVDVIGSSTVDYPAISLFFSHETNNQFHVQVDDVTGSSTRSSLEEQVLGAASSTAIDMKTALAVGAGALSGTVTVDGVAHTISESFSFTPVRVAVMCGVYYAGGNTAGTFVTEITDLDIEACPR